MPYDPGLAARLEDMLAPAPGFQQKKMFGGIGWLLNGNMCVGVYKDWLIARVGPAASAKVLEERNVKAMDITGKPMKGWVMVDADGTAEDAKLERFTKLATDFVKTLPEK